MSGPETPAAAAVPAPRAVAAGPLVITVHGTPAPQGSKRHVGNGVMIESSKKVKPWREAVKWAALDELGDYFGPGFAFFNEPLYLGVAFYLPRPRSHYRTGKHSHELRDNAPHYVGKRPDLDKLLRSTLDALGEAGCWIDDAQVAHITAMKMYADGRQPGAYITVAGAVP